MNTLDKWLDRLAWLAVGAVGMWIWTQGETRYTTALDTAYVHEHYIPDDCGTWDTVKGLPGARGHGRQVECERKK